MTNLYAAVTFNEFRWLTIVSILYLATILYTFRRITRDWLHGRWKRLAYSILIAFLLPGLFLLSYFLLMMSMTTI